MIKYLLTILKYACPLLLVVLPCVVAFGMLSPWSVAEAALGAKSTRGTVLIGWQYDYHASGKTSHARREQTYALLPTLKTITVIQEDGNVRTEESPNGLISMMATCLFLVLGTWWFWIRPKRVAAYK